MCGIAGVVGRTNREELGRMAVAMRHRGPDGEGFYLDDQVGLAARRLAIIDLTPRAQQPLANEDGTLQLLCNGEVYNYQDLARGLRSRGHTFRTSCDAEVILHLYEERGQACVDALRGMFAIALWDARRRQLLLVRDRLGVKPLYYTRVGGRLLFASELKALLASGAIAADLEPGAIPHLLGIGAVPVPWTIWRGVLALEPGQMLVSDGREERTERYWALPDRTESRSGRSDAELVEELRARLQESVRLRMVSDVPVGVFLSGGVDSTTIVSLASQASADPLKTFCVGFGVGEDLDEFAYARQVAKHFGTNHEECSVDCTTVLGALDDAVWSIDQPTSDAINSYFVSRAASRHVKVALSGVGADELFGGYGTFKLAALAARLRLLAPRREWIQRVVQRTRERLRPARAESWVWRILAATVGASGATADAYAELRHAFASRELGEILGGDYAKGRCGTPGSEVEELLLQRPLAGAVDQVSFLEMHLYLGNLILRDTDAVSMAHGLEVRTPFLDHPLVEFAVQLPSHLKLGRTGRTKVALREAARQIIPPNIAERRKAGFRLPMGIWLRDTRFRRIVMDCLSHPSVTRRGVFQPEAVDRVVSAFYGREVRGTPDRSWQRLWALTVFELWARRFLDRPVGDAVCRPAAAPRIAPPHRRPRVMLVARVFPPRTGGIETYVAEIYRRLASDVDVHVVTPRFPGGKTYDSSLPMSVRRVPRLADRWKLPLATLAPAVFMECLRFRPDQIHCDQVEAVAAAYLAARVLGIPVVTYAYGMEITDRDFPKAKAALFRRTAMVVAISDHTRNSVSALCGRSVEQIPKVWPGVEAARWATDVGPEEARRCLDLAGRRVLLTVGRLAEKQRYKGQDTVIAALPEVLRVVSDACYVIVGSGGDRARLENLADDLAVAHAVRFAGKVPDELLPLYYAAADIFVMPSRTVPNGRGGSMGEGFGIVYLEAGAAGKPVIGARAGGVTDAIEDGVSGMLVMPDAPAELSAAIIQLLTDSDLASRMGAAGRERARSMFSWDEAGRKVFGLVRSLRARPEGAPVDDSLQLGG